MFKTTVFLWSSFEVWKSKKFERPGKLKGQKFPANALPCRKVLNKWTAVIYWNQDNFYLLKFVEYFKNHLSINSFIFSLIIYNSFCRLFYFLQPFLHFTMLEILPPIVYTWKKIIYHMSFFKRFQVIIFFFHNFFLFIYFLCNARVLKTIQNQSLDIYLFCKIK